MGKIIADWPAAMAQRLGLRGSVNATNHPNGQTLHLPCSGSGGHIVDVRIGAKQHPDAVANKLSAQGWLLGRKLKCPRHARKEKVAHDTALSVDGALPSPVELPSPPVAVKSHASAGRKRWEGMSKEDRQAAMAKVTAARLEKQVKGTAMASAAVVETNAENMSADARRAHRLVIAALEDYYDEREHVYRKGYSDRRIADELKISEESVAKTREDFFGPLAPDTPLEVQLMADSIKSMRVAVEDSYRAAIAAVEAQENKLEALCRAKGWSVA